MIHTTTRNGVNSIQKKKLAEIRELARVGNQSKTRYVWTIHPFMNNPIRFGNEAHYQEDLATIKANTQLMKVGVREFGILADDAPSPASEATIASTA